MVKNGPPVGRDARRLHRPGNVRFHEVPELVHDLRVRDVVLLRHFPVNFRLCFCFREQALLSLQPRDDRRPVAVQRALVLVDIAVDADFATPIHPAADIDVIRELPQIGHMAAQAVADDVARAHGPRPYRRFPLVADVQLQLRRLPEVGRRVRAALLLVDHDARDAVILDVPQPVPRQGDHRAFAAHGH